MQSTDSTEIFFLKLLPWVEANKTKLIGGVVVLAAVALSIWFYDSQQEQKEIAAGEALTQAIMSGPSAPAESYLKIAADHPGTLAAQRAQLQGASALFDVGRYDEAQAQFQKFLDAYPENDFTPQATLGVAASLDAQGKTDLAVAAYQRAANTADSQTVYAAKFALARINDSQGHLTEAMNAYEEIARANPSGTLGSEAAMRLMELRARIQTPAPAAAAPAVRAPFTLTH